MSINGIEDKDYLATAHPEHTEPNNEVFTQLIGNFTFLEQKPAIPPFKYHYHHRSKNLKFDGLGNKETYKLVIYIIIENDSLMSSINLKNVITSIYNNLPSLRDINISNTKILLCLFILQIKQERTFQQFFPGMDYLSSCCANSPNFNCSLKYVVSPTSIPFDIICLNKNNSSIVEALKCFYVGILYQLKFIIRNSDEIYAITLKNGIYPTENAFVDLIHSCYSVNGMTIGVVPGLQPNDGKNTFSLISQYELLNDELFSMRFYEATVAVPLDERFNLLKINFVLFERIKEYFTNNIYEDAGIIYHNFKFSTFLYDLGYDIGYSPEITGTFDEGKVSFNKLMQRYSDKLGGEFIAFFDLIRSLFVVCKIYKSFIRLIAKILLFFQILGSVCLFLLPAIFINCSYSLFRVVFSTEDDRLSIFFTVLYVIFLILSCCFSLISINQSDNDHTFLILHILFYLYYLFIYLCVFITIHFVRINNTDDKYAFNQTAFITLFVLNVAFIFIPMVVNGRKMLKNLKGFLLYTIVGIPSYSSVFLFHSLMNCTDQFGYKPRISNEKKKEVLNERKRYFVLLFILSNTFCSFMIFFLITRTQRMNLILGVGCLFTVLNGVKVLSFVISVLKSRYKEFKAEKTRGSLYSFKRAGGSDNEEKRDTEKDMISNKPAKKKHTMRDSKTILGKANDSLRDRKKTQMNKL